MPPLPTSLDAQMLSTIDAVGRRLRDLAEVQVPRLRACTGPLARQQQFAGELRDDTDTCAQHIEVCEACRALYNAIR
jgi:protein transport protein SEC20